jgi:Fur family ferric uptake transcriptional regulator
MRRRARRGALVTPTVDLVESAIALVRANGQRVGVVRRRLIEAFAGSGGAMTAEELANAVPDVHVSSVYRNLQVLEDLGVVRHVHLAHGPARYELAEVAESTRHLVCRECGSDTPVPAGLLVGLKRTIERDYGFELDAGHFALLGLCARCVAKEKRRSTGKI